MKRIKIELFATPGCSHCARTAGSLKAVLEQFGEDSVNWREVNLLEELDYAVELGLTAPSAIAIDGELVFPRLPSAATLREELEKRLLAKEDRDEGS